MNLCLKTDRHLKPDHLLAESIMKSMEMKILYGGDRLNEHDVFQIIAFKTALHIAHHHPMPLNTTQSASQDPARVSIRPSHSKDITCSV